VPGGTIILQSHRESGLPDWIDACLESVRAWSTCAGYDYQFTGDEMLQRVPSLWREKTAHHSQIAADLGRLYLLREALENGADQAVWIDADVLVFNPEDMTMEAESAFAFGRELWVEEAGRSHHVRRNVHNAMMIMKPGNPVLEFYIHAAERILDRLAASDGPAQVPAQIIGPKLLGALHNFADFPLLDDVAMISPAVLNDIAAGGGAALNALISALPVRPGAVNLSASLIDDDSIARRAIEQLRFNPDLLSPHRDEESP